MNSLEAHKRILEKHCMNNSNKANKCPVAGGTVNACQDKCMYGPDSCEYAVAMDALKKQIPMKPRITPYEKANGHSFSCAVCTGFFGNVCLNRWQNYCHNCGQAIDWSDVEPNGKLKEGVEV